MQKTRIWVLIFATLALAASSAALYVHYNLLKDSAYTSFCDVNATVSCDAVLRSAYADRKSTRLNSSH